MVIYDVLPSNQTIRVPEQFRSFPILGEVAVKAHELAKALAIETRGVERYPEIAGEVELILAALIRKGVVTTLSMAQGYVWLCKDHISCQRHLMKHGCYKNSSFAEVNASHYQTTVMQESYLIGLLLSTALWPNHAAIAEMYVNEFLEKVSHGRILEIGCGHGLFTLLALKNRPGNVVTAVDISPYSIEMTKHVLETLGRDPATQKFHLLNEDVFQCGFPEHSFDAITMAEVIEHLERPEDMVRRVAKFLKPGGRLWITTCANAGHTDHIYLFNNVAEMRDFLTGCGLKILKEQWWALGDTPEENWEKYRIPVNYAAICTV